ncbi:MAG: LamG domain-containing protein [Sulfuritalea sp.]|nr:LamG domain-containing protein [Sulfuritalea sp.]
MPLFSMNEARAAVAHDAASESHAGTTGSTNQASFSWTHTVAGTPRGVLVYILTRSATKTVTGVTYGGVAMTEIAGGAAVDTAGEAARVETFFLGASIPTGAQTITVSRTSNATIMYASAATQTAAGNTEVTGIVLVTQNGTYVQQSVNDGSLGSNSLRYAAGYSGGNNVLAAGAQSTALNSIDFGSYTMTLVRETTAGQGARNVGFTYGTSDDRAAVHLAVRETRTTLATGTDPAAATIPPGDPATDVDWFTLQTSGGTETLTTVTVNLSTNSGVGRLAITDASDAELGFTTTPANGSNTITVSGMSADSTLTTFKVRITPLSHAAMPAVPGAAYAITAPVTSWAGSNALHNGSDTNTNALTIDNLSPNAATATSGAAGEAEVTLNWTTSSSADFTATSGSVVYRWAAASAGAEVPVEGSTPTLGSTNSTATVACLVSSAASTALARIDGSGGSAECTTAALTKDQPYTYTVFQKDSSGNYDVGFSIGSFTPTYPTVVSIVRAGASPTSAATVAWTVTFSSSVTGVNAADFSLAATGLSGAFITTVSGAGTGWTVTANTGIGAGTLGLNLVDDDTIIDASGRKLGATGANNGNFTGEVYTITTTPALAEYRMDEALWTTSAGQVVDSSGGGYHAQAFNSATTIDGSRAIAGNPGTCRYGVFDNGGTITQGYVETPLPNLTTDFTVTAWIRTTNNAATAQRILIDDQNNSGGYGISLGDGGAGRIRFYSRGIVPIILDSTYSIANNTWYFVAAVADIANKMRTIFVFDSSGTLLNSTTEAAWTGGAWGTDAGPVSIGAEVNGPPQTELPATNHFRGNLDEVRVYQKVLSLNALAAIATQTHACPMPDHYELSLPSASISCLPSTVTVTACADSSSPCSNPSPNVTNETATLGTNAGTLGASTVTFNAGGIATTTLSHPAAGNGDPATVTLSGESYPAINARQCCPDGTSCVVANSCATTFSTAGFVVSASAGGGVATIPTQVAGTTSAQYYLRAVKTSTTTKACESALAGANTVNFAHECNNPTSCWTSNLMSVNGGSATTIARNNNGSVSSYTSVNMTFDVDGNAPFTFNYSDVGLVTLHMAKTVNSAPLSGSSNAFVVKPGGFLLSAIPGNPGAADASGATFVKAGGAFSATVTATTSGGAATPNYGKETAAEGVKLSVGPVAPSVGLFPALTNNTAFGAFTDGVATGTTFAWNEVGIITLTPSVGDGDYLGAGDVTGTTTGNIGRFYPDHFETAVTAAPMGCGALAFVPACPAGSHLAYSGQSFTTEVTAYTLGGTGGVGITSNYRATESFAKAVTLTAWDGIGSTSQQNPPTSSGTLTGNSIAAASFAAGVATASPVYTYTASPTAPTNVYLRAIDTDAVSSLNAVPANSVEGGIKVVNGRLQIENMYGPPPSRLGAKVRARYWSGTQWALNTSDTVSGAATGNFALGDHGTCVTPTFCGITLSSAGALSGADGEFRVVLTPPTSGSGRRSVLLNSSLPYLSGSGRQTWGSFRAPYIHQQER